MVWLAAMLLASVRMYVAKHVRSKTARELIGRALDEVADAVAATYSRFVEGAKAGAKDGKLTSKEAGAAFDMAVAEARSNIGTKGLKRLTKILGVDIDGWLGSKVEASVPAIKKELARPAVPLGR